MNDAILKSFYDRQMTGFQIAAVAICLVINMLDGFDILAIAFTAPGIAREWHLAPQTLGVLFSSGLVGMTLGSLIIAPMADKVGRRKVILMCLVIITAGMLASALTENVIQLSLTRALTGLAIGGILASINTIVAEFSSNRRRDLAISFMHIGYPIGATVGGGISAYLILFFGWRAVFILGGIASAIMIPLVIRYLPESLDYLLTRRPDDALERVNRLMHRLNQPPIAALPQLKQESIQKYNSFNFVFSPALKTSSVLLWTGFFLLMFSTFFVQSWTPKILVDSGLSQEQGVFGGVLLTLGGIFGGLVLGFASDFVSLGKRVVMYMTMTAVAMITYGAIHAGNLFMFIITFIIGFFIFGAMIGLYAIAPRIYPAGVRVTGIGWGIGVGRIGAILGPYIAGILIGNGIAISTCYYFYAAVLALAVLVLLFLKVPSLPA